jgi:hypothetical protein
LGAADRLVTATNNILTTVGGTSPVDDVVENVVQAARDVADDVRSAAAVGGSMVALGVGLVAGVWLLSLLSRSR